MKRLAPAGPVYQAGTLSGNPVAGRGGNRHAARLERELYDRLESLGARLEAGIRATSLGSSFPGNFNAPARWPRCFFTDRPVKNFTDAQTCDTRRFALLPRDARPRHLSAAQPVRGIFHQRCAHGEGH